MLLLRLIPGIGPASVAFGVGNGSSAALGGRSATQRARFTKVMVDCGEILVSAKSHCRKINQQKKRGGRTKKGAGFNFRIYVFFSLPKVPNCNHCICRKIQMTIDVGIHTYFCLSDLKLSVLFQLNIPQSSE